MAEQSVATVDENEIVVGDGPDSEEEERAGEEAPAEEHPEKTAEETAAEQEAQNREEEELSAKEAEEAEEDKKPVSARAQRRIDRATRAKEEAETRAQAAQEEIDRLKGEAAKSGKTASAAPSTEEFTEPMPKTDEVGTKFKSYDDYVQALVAWQEKKVRFEVQKEQREADKKKSEEAAKARNAETAKKYDAGVEEAKKKHPDFEKVVQPLKVAPAVQVGVFECEDGPEIAYYLGKNPDDVKRLNALADNAKTALDAMHIGIEIGRISAKATAAPARSVTRAPAPIEHVAGRNGGKNKVDRNTNIIVEG